MRFIEGLRAVTPEEFADPIAVDGSDGLTVINDPAVDEVVASEERFELTAVQVGDEVCTKLEETTVATTMVFAAICWDAERFAESGIVDLVPLDPTDTQHLIVGVVDAPAGTADCQACDEQRPGAARRACTGCPRSGAGSGAAHLAGRGVRGGADRTGQRGHRRPVFLARLDLDVSDGIRLDLFTIEDASG